MAMIMTKQKTLIAAKASSNAFPVKESEREKEPLELVHMSDVRGKIGAKSFQKCSVLKRHVETSAPKPILNRSVLDSPPTHRFSW